MGHNRLGRLPKTARWAEVVRELSTSEPDAQRVALAAIEAAQEYLRSAAHDAGVRETFALLVRLMSAARGAEFVNTVRSMGMTVEDDTPAVLFVAQVADELRRQLSASGQDTVNAEYAAMALRKVLLATVGTRPGSLFGATVDDIRLAFASFATDRQFGMLAQRFFGDFLARVLRGALDREVPHVARSTGEAEAMLVGVELHAFQSARIVTDFASDWYSLHQWTGRGEIAAPEVNAFLAVAFRKMRAELKREAART
jgi:hypothetical protein